MPEIELRNKIAIIKALENAYSDVSTFISELKPEELNQKMEGKWSALEQLEHLILSSKGVASVLNKPKENLKAFGVSENGSRSFDELFSGYKNVLNTGVKAPPRFSPDESNPFTREELIANWMLIKSKFSQRIGNWTEEDLDKYRLPHPALGKITIREMLFFTIFHTKHHLQSMKNIFNR